MRYRLAAELPLTVALDSGDYVLDLVQAATGTGCYLRVRATDQPVVFLLAKFPTRREAHQALATGFEIDNRAFPLRLLERLVAMGAAEPVNRRARPRLPERKLEPVPPGPARVLQLA